MIEMESDCTGARGDVSCWGRSVVVSARFPQQSVKYPYLADLDVKQHWREWQQVALPVAVLVAAGLLVSFLVLRSRLEVQDFAAATEKPARIDLLAAEIPEEGAASPFDPSFLVASPLEMARAPVALRFDHPELPLAATLADPLMAQGLATGADEASALSAETQDPAADATPDPAESPRRVFAAADGLVVFAGAAPLPREKSEPAPDGGEILIVLLHRLPEGGFVQSRYEGLASTAVPVGRQVRRGDAVGALPDDALPDRGGASDAGEAAAAPPQSRRPTEWRFEIRLGTAFGIPTRPERREATRLATEDFLRERGGEEGAPRVEPVRGETLEGGILRLERLESL